MTASRTRVRESLDRLYAEALPPRHTVRQVTAECVKEHYHIVRSAVDHEIDLRREVEGQRRYIEKLIADRAALLPLARRLVYLISDEELPVVASVTPEQLVAARAVLAHAAVLGEAAG